MAVVLLPHLLFPAMSAASVLLGALTAGTAWVRPGKSSDRGKGGGAFFDAGSSFRYAAVHSVSLVHFCFRFPVFLGTLGGSGMSADSMLTQGGGQHDGAAHGRALGGVVLGAPCFELDEASTRLLSG